MADPVLSSVCVLRHGHIAPAAQLWRAGIMTGQDNRLDCASFEVAHGF